MELGHLLHHQINFSDLQLAIALQQQEFGNQAQHHNSQNAQPPPVPSSRLITGPEAVLWYADTLKAKSSLEEHSQLITDVRFSPSIPRLATSSFDKTVRVWDADKPTYSLRTFTGHSMSVMSLDFHPNREDLICSCDGDSEIRFWSVNNGSCTRVFRGGMNQMRFQPRLGKYLAATSETVVSILDVETQACRTTLHVTA